MSYFSVLRSLVRRLSVRLRGFLQGAPASSPDDYLQLIQRHLPGAWDEGDDLLTSKKDPQIQVERVLGGKEYHAGWLRPTENWQPYLFQYSFLYRDSHGARDQWLERARLTMVQVTPTIELPLPHMERGRLFIDEFEYYWARMKSLNADELDQYLDAAGIEVKRGGAAAIE